MYTFLIFMYFHEIAPFLIPTMLPSNHNTCISPPVMMRPGTPMTRYTSITPNLALLYITMQETY